METKIDQIKSDLLSLTNELLGSAQNVLAAGNGDMYSLDFFVLTINNRVISLIKGYVSLVEANNYISAVSLIRLQLDNVFQFYASRLIANSDDFVMHFLDGKETRDYKDIDDKRLTDNYLARRFECEVPGIYQLYKECCSFIHLSNKHYYSILSKTGEVNIGEVDSYSTEQKMNFSQNMLDVSRLTLIMNKHYAEYKDKLYCIRNNKSTTTQKPCTLNI